MTPPVVIAEFGLGGVEADLESLDLAEPAVGLGFLDAFAEVVDDFDEAVPLSWIDAQHGAANTGLTEIILEWTRVRFDACGSAQ